MTGPELDQTINTLQAHILAQEHDHPESGGTLAWILSALSISAKAIAAQIRRARLIDVLGNAGDTNVQGEQQQKLDVLANEILLRTLGKRDDVAVVASEENEAPVTLRAAEDGKRRFCVMFDPLDGSTNLDVAGGVGTIFSIVRHDRRASDPAQSILLPGSQQVAAGYILYGPSTVFTLTLGNGVQMFVLDPSIGAFLRVEDDLRIPQAKAHYSVNEGNRLSFPDGYQNYLHWAQQQSYSARYAGAMVADVHRILLKGGVFLYPPTAKAPDGKLRLLYEANPMGMLVEQAGGLAMAAPNTRLLDIQPTEVHQRTPVIMGSAEEVRRVLEFVSAAGSGSSAVRSA
ncbi:MAG TPA: class 1 fructose-bisphosphatase [Gammaproteobacteria bacterium]|nr:class 1 fructose-bisphosphatase [Gammaproteobacteria bacterium]